MAEGATAGMEFRISLERVIQGKTASYAYGPEHQSGKKMATVKGQQAI